MGNHGVKNIGCKKLVSLLGMPDHFYDVTVAPGWKFLFLDGTDMSFMIDSYSKDEAEEYHKIHKDRLYGWNGGLGKEQRDWLQKMMREAKENGEKLILFCHWPLINLWTKEYEKSLLWNNEDILEMLDPEDMHSNGYIYQKGIHFLTFGGTITAPVGETAHGVLHLHQHGVLLEGFGELSSVSHFYSV